MKSNIALIGFMGVGKSAVGKSLATRLGKDFIELDQLIEQRAGKSIAEIFSQNGEITFREYEIALTKEISTRENLVIACGGGLVLNKINIDRLRKNAVIVLLTAAKDVILKRTSRHTNRPLLNGTNKAKQIEELLEYRQPFYNRAAEIIVDTSGLSTTAVAGKIIKELKRV